MAFIVTVMAALLIQGCGPLPNNSNQTASSTNGQEPVIEATPVKPGENNWLIASNDTATLNITAPGDESEREDKFTGGRIETAALAENQSDIKITVDVPAFRLTLWQNGKEVKTYEIGVGRRDFPLAIGMRRATQVIWNPEWVPPD